VAARALEKSSIPGTGQALRVTLTRPLRIMRFLKKRLMHTGKFGEGTHGGDTQLFLRN
jgi:hypothetical protein